MSQLSYESFALGLVDADRQKAMADLADAIKALKGDAVGRGRLHSGFFVSDLQGLCERFLEQRGQEIVAAYESALAAKPPELAFGSSDDLPGRMRRQIRIDAQNMKAEFQRSLLRDHLPAPNALSRAGTRVEAMVVARGQVLAARFAAGRPSAALKSVSARPSVGEVRPSPGSADIIELKPGFMGITINVRALARRLKAWWLKREVRHGR